MTACGLIERPRLIELVAERWSRRAVTVIAGPGFGKSVLLAQATSENQLAPRGVDVHFECGGRDRWPHHFLTRLADSIGCDVDSAAVSPERITSELARRWPMGVCLVLDDVHHLISSADGERLLSRLVDDAPPAVHFLLAGRKPVRGLARLRAMGELLVITERDLAFDGDESVTFAAAQGADVDVVARAGGWPAVAAVAATYGISGATEYVWEAVLDRLDLHERRVVATAAVIGHCDAELLRAAVGQAAVDPVEVLASLPLVSRPDGHAFAVHDLWRRVVDGVLDDGMRLEAVNRCVDALIGRRAFDRAFDLCAANDLWDRAADVLQACCSRGYPDALPHVLEGWLDQLPPSRFDEPDGLLLRGLVEKARDPFGASAAKLLARAATAHRMAGNIPGEVAASNELAFVLRNQGRCDEVPRLIMRVAALHSAGHAEAEGSMALFRSVLAEATGDSARTIAELDVLPTGSLSREWRAVVEFRRATAQLTLGNDHDMLAAAEECARLAGPTTTMRHVVALSRWFMGDPLPALRACDELVVDAAHSRVDGVALGAFATMVLASSGRNVEASERLAATERAARGGALAPLMAGYLVGVRALVAAACGDEEGAAAILREAIANDPLEHPVGWMRAARWLPLAYVLVPTARPQIDNADLGPVHRRRVAVARAVASARENRSLDPSLVDGIDAGLLATTVPLPWAMALASRLTAGAEERGRELAAALFDIYGAPARDALRACGDGPDQRLAKGARALLAGITLAPRHNVRLDVLGRAELRVGDDPAGTDWNRERVRSLLLYLTLNGPSRREQIVDALWPDLDVDAADRNLRVTLSYLQRVLEPDRRRGEAPFFVRQLGNTLSLAGAPHLVIDSQRFETLTDQAAEADRRGVPSAALDALERAIELWRGPCLGDIVYEEWAQPYCHELGGRFVRAAVRAAELHLAAGGTADARRLARRALAVDTWSEAAYRVLIAADLADGDQGSAARALAECDRRLAELGVTAGAETDMLRRRLLGTYTAATAAAS